MERLIIDRLRRAMKAVQRELENPVHGSERRQQLILLRELIKEQIPGESTRHTVGKVR